jgi:hypothetical protein
MCNEISLGWEKEPQRKGRKVAQGSQGVVLRSFCLVSLVLNFLGVFVVNQFCVFGGKKKHLNTRCATGRKGHKDLVRCSL